MSYFIVNMNLSFSWDLLKALVGVYVVQPDQVVVVQQ